MRLSRHEVRQSLIRRAQVLGIPQPEDLSLSALADEVWLRSIANEEGRQKRSEAWAEFQPIERASMEHHPADKALTPLSVELTKKCATPLDTLRVVEEMRRELENKAARPKTSSTELVKVQLKDKIPPKLRYQVLARDNFKCMYCGRSAPTVSLHIDHIKPESMGGLTTLENLITSCAECNQGKGAAFFQSAVNQSRKLGVRPAPRPLNLDFDA